MLIKKTFHFYAAHRNQSLKGKCSNIHGHRYGVTCYFEVHRNPNNPSVTVLFEDYDKIEKLLKDKYDHSMLIDIHDELYSTITNTHNAGKTLLPLKVVEMNGPTSVENLCYELYGDITDMDFELVQIEVQETDTSTVIYNRKDFEEDFSSELRRETNRIDSCDHEFVGLTCKNCGITQYLLNVMKRKADDRTNRPHPPNSKSTETEPPVA